jgi:EmrB/QacA subfamily drug resistance transporter
MTSQQRWTLVATIIGSSLTFVDATAVNVALSALQVNLHATMTQVQWVIEAYALFLGALVLVGGSIGDQFGRKRVFVAGVVLFTAASVFCGLAPSARALIAARILQGIGAAFVVPASLAIISGTFEDADRGRAIGTWSGFSAMTAAIGPVAGGWLTEHVSWRAVFFLNVPLAFVVLALSWRFMKESHDPSRAGRIDWPGGALAVLGFGGIVYGLLEWPRLGAGAPVVAAIVIGVVSLALLLGVERRSENPMLPLTLFRSRAFTLANLLTLLLYAALGVVMFVLPLNLIQVQRYTATAAGAALLPFIILMFVLSRWSGGLVATIGSRIPLSVGPVVAALGLGLFARPGIGGSYWTTFFPAVLLLGFGMAITVAPLTTTVMGAVEREHAGVASGVNNAVARVAGLLAIAVFGLVLARAFDGGIKLRLDGLELSPPVRAAVDRELPKMAGAELDVGLLDARQSAAVHEAIDEAFVSSFRLVMIEVAALAVAAGVVGASIR